MSFLPIRRSVRLTAVLLLAAPTAGASEEDEATEAQTPAATSPRPSPKASGFSGRIQAGYGGHVLFDTPISGGTVEAGLGGFHKRLEAYIDGRLFLGDARGLPWKQFSVGPAVDYEVFSRFRLGAGLSLGGTVIGRKTKTDSFTSFSIGGRAFASYDLWQFDDVQPHSALYLLGQVEATSEGYPSFRRKGDRDGVGPTSSRGLSFMIGARF